MAAEELLLVSSENLSFFGAVGEKPSGGVVAVSGVLRLRQLARLDVASLGWVSWPVVTLDGPASSAVVSFSSSLKP